MRCIPQMESNVIMLYEMGNTTKVVYRPTCIAPGVDTHYVHAYNVASGWIQPGERTQAEREAESIRTSVSRSVRAVRELAACNPWQFFITITLSPSNWKNRYTPDGLQDVIKAMAKRWRRKRKNGSAYCPGFKYLIIPEMHKDGAIHLHGFVSSILLSGAFDAATACNGWRNSPGHYANILTPGYTRMGIGCTYSYEYGAAVWCVTFS